MRGVNGRKKVENPAVDYVPLVLGTRL